MFGTSPAKTQHGDGHEPSKSQWLPLEMRSVAKRRRSRRLFDGHRKPSDQLGNLVQLAGIGLRDGARQPLQTLIIAQRGNLVGDDRGRRLAPNYLDDV